MVHLCFITTHTHTHTVHLCFITTHTHTHTHTVHLCFITTHTHTHTVHLCFITTHTHTQLRLHGESRAVMHSGEAQWRRHPATLGSWGGQKGVEGGWGGQIDLVCTNSWSGMNDRKVSIRLEGRGAFPFPERWFPRREARRRRLSRPGVCRLLTQSELPQPDSDPWGLSSGGAHSCPVVS